MVLLSCLYIKGGVRTVLVEPIVLKKVFTLCILHYLHNGYREPCVGFQQDSSNADLTDFLGIS